MPDYQLNTPQADPIGFFSHDTVRELMGGLAKNTLKRWEDQGRFPQRVYLSHNRVVWTRAEVMSYLSDPKGWQERNAGRGAGTG
ncbi:MAG: AlpA family phage regulatory protein [Aquisalimonadaceae bacterium]